ncbi:hypothetical protein WJX77_009025 [Trebouxia sp. C0004]
MRRVADLLADERNVNISSSACNGVKLICDHMQDPSVTHRSQRRIILKAGQGLNRLCLFLTDPRNQAWGIVLSAHAMCHSSHMLLV